MEEQGAQTYLPSVSQTSQAWVFWGRRLPKAEIVFFSQIIILYIVIITCIINLSIGSQADMWLILLSTSLGAILPNPNLKISKKERDISPA